MLEGAFNALYAMHSRPAILRRLGSPTVETAIRIMPSNYFRFLEGPSQTTIHGREFIISRATIASPLTPIIKRGDKIVDSTYGTMAIDEIMEMVDLGGAIIAWRCRCE